MSELDRIYRSIDTSIITLPKRGISSRETELRDESVDEDELEEDYTFDPGEVNLAYAETAALEEQKLIQRFYNADESSFKNLFIEAEDALYDDFDGLGAYYIGMGGLVFALASMDCVMADCSVGSEYPEEFPKINTSIKFWAQVEMVNLLLLSAQDNDVEIKNGPDGTLEVFCDDLRKYNSMASFLLKNR